ncbi:uncharacterized protein LOC126485015 [Schistocerca serialis cubense]|uniref:uncharacterized protein LOC126485015 n=2 Tax=Schistocerca TaxID=7008 RepID=UPI00214F05EF|nr:uncharacterized protein LOC126485015 [Schistocerca serialis cubense]
MCMKGLLARRAPKRKPTVLTAGVGGSVVWRRGGERAGGEGRRSGGGREARGGALRASRTVCAATGGRVRRERESQAGDATVRCAGSAVARRDASVTRVLPQRLCMRRPPLDIALPLTLLVPPALDRRRAGPRPRRRVDDDDTTPRGGWPEGDADAAPCDARGRGGSNDDAGGPPSRMTTGSGSHMAAHLAKWWKTKFLNGYKQFTVVPTECSDGRASDTEELLARPLEAGCDQPPQQQQPPPQPPPQQQQPPSPSHPLAFEEFECDVSVEGGVDAGGQERQEFSFTLYDFDGHGKITKDDIAGLVTTIYETLGSSIKVPHYGSKTIKVKLTVSPDQRKSAEQQQQHNQPQPQASGRKLKRDLNVTIRESRQAGPATRRKRAETAAPAPAAPPHSCSSGSATAPGSENNDDGAADISEDDDEDEGTRQHPSPRVAVDSARLRNRRYQQHVASRYRQQHSTYCADSSVLRQRTKKRSGSLQREELLQIIQANMDKNNLGFQTSRKQCDRGGLVDIRHAHHRHRHKTSHREEVQLHYLAHSPAPNCYLDLAGLEHKLQHCHHECRHGVEKSVQQLQHSRQGCHTRGHHRSRSHDLGRSVPVAPVGTSPNRYPTAAHLPPPRVCAAADDITSSPFHFGRARSKSHEDPGPDRRKLPPFVMGHTSSPHHLKHRNREQDQARAMAQVVRWLEQEFSSGLGTADRFASGNSTQPPPPPEGPPSGQPEAGNNSTAAGVSSVERHEHHHVHEHIHHHYHHYRETPVLV